MFEIQLNVCVSLITRFYLNEEKKNFCSWESNLKTGLAVVKNKQIKLGQIIIMVGFNSCGGYRQPEYPRVEVVVGDIDLSGVWFGNY